jgi:hypothetical protein
MTTANNNLRKRVELCSRALDEVSPGWAGKIPVAGISLGAIVITLFRDRRSAVDALKSYGKKEDGPNQLLRRLGLALHAREEDEKKAEKSGLESEFIKQIRTRLQQTA